MSALADEGPTTAALNFLEVSSATKRNIYQHAYRDLSPTWRTSFAKLVVAFTISGAAVSSLLAQFVSGGSANTFSFWQYSDESSGSHAVAILAFIVFPALSAIVLRAISSRIQFRAITRRRRSLVVFSLAISLCALNAYYELAFTFATSLAWFLASAASFYSLASIGDKLDFSSFSPKTRRAKTP